MNEVARLSDDAPRERERKRLRKAQTREVMPLIGPLLDAWENVPNDLKGEIEEGAADLAEALDSINDAMENAE